MHLAGSRSGGKLIVCANMAAMETSLGSKTDAPGLRWTTLRHLRLSCSATLERLPISCDLRTRTCVECAGLAALAFHYCPYDKMLQCDRSLYRAHAEERQPPGLGIDYVGVTSVTSFLKSSRIGLKETPGLVTLSTAWRTSMHLCYGAVLAALIQR